MALLCQLLVRAFCPDSVLGVVVVVGVALTHHMGVAFCHRAWLCRRTLSMQGQWEPVPG